MTLREDWIRLAYHNSDNRSTLLPMLTAGYIPEPRWYSYKNAPMFYYDIGFPDGHRVITNYIAQGLNNTRLPDNVREVIVQTLDRMQRTRKHSVQETFDTVEKELEKANLEFPIHWKATVIRTEAYPR